MNAAKATSTAAPRAAAPPIAWDERLRQVVIVIGRLALGYLFFTQLWWKVPPSFGCPAGFAVTTGTVDASRRAQLQRTSGLCDWIGVESVWATAPHPVLLADLKPIGGPALSVDIGPLARLNGLFLDNFAIPNLRWFGYVIWGMEAFIFASLVFGVFSRLGALVAVAQSLQLWVGLAGIANPFEWEWAYNQMVVLSLLMLGLAPGRWLGLDAWLRPRLAAAAERGSRLAGALLWLT
jgi:hypothetical protein